MQKTKEKYREKWEKQPMLKPHIEKVTVNMGVGESGEKLIKAENLLQELTGQKPLRTAAKVTNPEWGIRKGEPIGCKVTLRGGKAEEFLKNAFEAIDNVLKASCFDDDGNFSFGIQEHIDLPGTKYDPGIGIFGMDVCVTLERPGYRIKKRRKEKKRILGSHLLSRREAMAFIQETFDVNIKQEE